MTSTYHSSFPPFTIDLNEDHQHHDHLLFSSKSTTEDAASSSSSISYPIFLNPSREEVGYYRTEFHPLHHQEGNLYGGSWDDHHTPTVVKENKNSQILSFPNKEEKSKSVMNEDHQSENGSMKRMSSKVRLMKKMIPSDHQTVPAETSIHKFGDVKARSSPLQDDSTTKNLSTNSNNTTRVCADCNTTKTPLWRSGPRGPKSLCNACGIRQRKARRALAAAQASANGTTFPTDKSASANNKVQNKEKKTNNNNSHLPFKKRCKFTAQSRGNYRQKQLCFEDLSSIILSKNSAFHHLFPQNEKEAAILLMALSYGIGMVHG